MEDFDINSLLFDVMTTDPQGVECHPQLYFKSNDSCLEISPFQDDIPERPPSSYQTIPTAVSFTDLVEKRKSDAPELEQYLKQTNGTLQEIRRKRKHSFSSNKCEKIVAKKSPRKENSKQIHENYSCTTIHVPDNDEIEIEKGTDMTCRKKTLKWSNYKCEDWWKLYDSSLSETEPPSLLVTGDKGFSFSPSQNVYICQKKNHFQITLVLDVPIQQRFIKVKDVYQNVTSYQAHLYAVKTESPQKIIEVEQSLTNRNKQPYHPVKFPVNDSSTKTLTIGRLHFSKTTSNNMRKKGKLNPDQRYFTLVVDIHACTKQGNYSVCRQSSEKLIVRATNPGQFENDVALWCKDRYSDSVYRMSHVGINNDQPEECLSVNGNFRLTGHIMQPSDRRIQELIQKSDTRQHLENVYRMKLYKYRFSKDYAEHAGLDAKYEEEKLGVVAQELKSLIPEAVTEASDLTLPSGTVVKDLLLVDKDRLLMESVGALQELIKVTKILTTRLVELEKRNEIVQVVLKNSISKTADATRFT